MFSQPYSALLLGQLTAQLLYQSWHVANDRQKIRNDQLGMDAFPLQSLSNLLPLLLANGSAGLCWWQWQQQSMAFPLDLSISSSLERAYYRHSAQIIQLETELHTWLTTLQNAGITPLVFKGWSVGRLYPAPGLRPYLDLDLLIPHTDQARAKQILHTALTNQRVDLHTQLTELPERPETQLYQRAIAVTWDNLVVQVLSWEDQLRLLCLHLLRHGAWRPIWLCDIAVMLENLPADFDWDYCLWGDPIAQDWVLATLQLAHQVLGANITPIPQAYGNYQLPSWLKPSLLRQWGQIYQHRDPPLHTYWHQPRQLLAALPSRWPNPIEATIAINGRFNNTPRFFYQLGEFFWRGVNYLIS